MKIIIIKLLTEEYYNDMISNGELNYKINHNKLKNEVDGTYTYSMWVYINGNETGVYNYFKSIQVNQCKYIIAIHNDI